MPVMSLIGRPLGLGLLRTFACNIAFSFQRSTRQFKVAAINLADPSFLNGNKHEATKVPTPGLEGDWYSELWKPTCLKFDGFGLPTKCHSTQVWHLPIPTKVPTKNCDLIRTFGAVLTQLLKSRKVFEIRPLR